MADAPPAEGSLLAVIGDEVCRWEERACVAQLV
jgi:hypothetical protein